MIENGKISIRQFKVLVMIATIGDSILVLPTIVAHVSKQDAWIPGIIGLLLGLAAVYLFSLAGKLYPHLSLVQSIKKIFGRGLGTFIASMFLIYPFLTGAAMLRELGDFLIMEMMQDTPIEAMQILFIGIVIMAVRLGIEVIGRTAEMFLPWIILFFLILTILISPQSNIEYVQPILENGINPIISATIPSFSFPYLELVIFLMITPYVKQRRKIKKAFLQGTLLGGIVIIITIFVCLLVLGPDQTGRILYPTYSLARMISIGGFFERVEAMLAFMWLLTIFTKITLNFYIFTLGLSQVLNLKEYRMLTFPTAILLIISSSIIAPNVTYFNHVIINYWPFFDFTYGLALPLLMLGAYYIRKKASSRLN